MKKGKLNVTYAVKNVGILGGTYLCGSADRYSTIDYNSLVQYASKAAHVPESSITMAMEALYDALSYFVLNGHSVQIPNLGTFYLTIKCKSEDSVEEFVGNFTSNLKSVNIRFLPCTEIKAAISNTSLSVEASDLTSYVNDEVQQVSKVYMLLSGAVVEAVNGNTAPASMISQININGKRLTKTALGSTPVTIQYNDGSATQTLVVPAEYLSQSYNNISVNFSRLKRAVTDIVYLTKITIANSTPSTLKEITFAAPASTGTHINYLFVNGESVADEGNSTAVAGSVATIRLIGTGFNAVNKIIFNGSEISSYSAGTTDITFSATLGNNLNTLALLAGEIPLDSCSFNASAAPSSTPHITSITANGDPLNNGSSTNITAGSTYNLSIIGENLTRLQTTNFSVPAGSSLAIVSKSSTLIAATLSSAAAGTFAVSYDGNTIFSGTLIAVEPTVTISAWKRGIDGAEQSLSVAYEAEGEESVASFTLVGENLDLLTRDNFAASPSNSFTELSYMTSLHQVAVTGVSANGSITVTYNNTTIATLYYNKSSEPPVVNP